MTNDFETFTDKGGRYVTAKVASVSMNHHGNMNIPESTHKSVFDGKEYLEYHADHDNQLLAFKAYDGGDAPPHAYTMSGEGSLSVPVEKALEWVGKRPPEEHVMFELQRDSEAGLPYIDVSGLPDVERGDSDE